METITPSKYKAPSKTVLDAFAPFREQAATQGRKPPPENTMLLDELRAVAPTIMGDGSKEDTASEPTASPFAADYDTYEAKLQRAVQKALAAIYENLQKRLRRESRGEKHLPGKHDQRTHGHGKAHVIISDKKHTPEMSNAYFGRNLATDEWATLAGAPVGSEVKVSVAPSGIFLEASGPYGFESRVTLTKDKGKVVVRLNEMVVDSDAPPGTGTKALSDIVSGSRLVGAGSINLLAAGSPSNPHANGFYTWPRLGFDARLGSGPTRRATAAGLSSKTMQGLMSTSKGRDWWKSNGEPMEMRFDLSPESVSSRVFDAYLGERGLAPTAK